MSDKTLRGKFITVEGVEGAGKSTQLPFIQSCLQDAGQTPLVTREPGGTPLGEEIRRLLLQSRDAGMTAKTELLLMFAARAEHIEAKILPALMSGQWVLCDRFTDSSYAYQGGGRGLHASLIQTLEQLVQDGLRPDMTIFFDMPVELSLQRIRGRDQLDRFESEDLRFFKAVREVYLERAARSPEIYKVIDASQSIAGVQRQVLQVITDLLTADEYSSMQNTSRHLSR